MYFADTLRGVWKIDPAGSLTFLGPPNFHFFALDEDNLFARYNRRTVEDEIHPLARLASPTLLTSSDFAVVAALSSKFHSQGRSPRL